MSDNPLIYRMFMAGRGKAGWKRWLGWLAYPLLVSTPFLLGVFQSKQPYHRNDPEMMWLLAYFLHFLYFAGRPLFATISTVAAERQRKTLDCLLTTGFSVREWAGTVFGCAVVPRMLEAVAFVWIFELFPHQEEHVVPQLLFVTLGCILCYAGLGMWISAHSRNQGQAQLRGILLLCTTMLFAVGIDVLLADVILRVNKPLLSSLCCPWLVIGLMWDDQARQLPPLPWLLCGVAHALVGVFSLARVEAYLASAPSAAVARSPRRNGLFQRIENPILYRCLLGLSGRRIWRVLAYPAVLLSLRFGLPMLADTHRSLDSALYLAIMAHIIYLTVRAMTAGSQAVAEERENRSWESLISTRVRPATLIFGHCVASLLPVLAECVLWSPVWLLYVDDFGGPMTMSKWFYLMIYSLAWTAFIGCFALWQSSRCSSAGEALRNTAIFVLVLSFGTLAFDAITSRLSDPCSAWFSPVFGLITLMESYDNDHAFVSLFAYVVALPLLLLFYARRLRHAL